MVTFCQEKLKKRTLGTLVIILVVFFMGFLQTNAFTYNQDFDSFSSGTMINTVSDWSGLMGITSSYSVSSPNSLFASSSMVANVTMYSFATSSFPLIVDFDFNMIYQNSATTNYFSFYFYEGATGNDLLVLRKDGSSYKLTTGSSSNVIPGCSFTGGTYKNIKFFYNDDSYYVSCGGASYVLYSTSTAPVSGFAFSKLASQNYYASVDDFTVTTVYSPDDDYSTHFISISPSSDEVVSTSSVPISFEGYVTDDDFVDDLFVRFSISSFQKDNLAVVSEFGPYFTVDVPVSSSGYFSYSTTTDFEFSGRHTISAILNKPYFFGLFNTQLSVLNSSFIVGQKTSLDTFVDDMGSTTADIIGEFSSSTLAVFDECSSASSLTDKILCNMGGVFSSVLRFLFVPSQSVLSEFADNLNDFKYKVPTGYFFRVFDLVNSYSSVSASSSVNLSITMPVSNTVFSGKTLVLFDWSYFNDYLEGSWWVTFNTYFSYLLWLGFAFWVYRYIMRSV